LAGKGKQAQSLSSAVVTSEHPMLNKFWPIVSGLSSRAPPTHWKRPQISQLRHECGGMVAEFVNSLNIAGL
jgi:hypothetical protein